MRQGTTCCKLILEGYSDPVRLAMALLVLATLRGSGVPTTTYSSEEPDGDRDRGHRHIVPRSIGVAAVNLRTGETIAVNADTRFPTASTIKTAVMVEAWQQIADGQLTLETVLPLQESAKVGGAGVLRGMHDGLALTVAVSST